MGTVSRRQLSDASSQGSAIPPDGFPEARSPGAVKNFTSDEIEKNTSAMA
jgi:hypothetical protein